MAKRHARKQIIVPAEYQQAQADRDAAKIQAYINEIGQVQARRLELAALLLQSAVTRHGLPTTREEADALSTHAATLANAAVERDCRERWAATRDLFAELDFEGPQPVMEWSAKKVGVTLFAESRILQPTSEDAAKVIQ